jgi:hypothetical protein
MRFASMEGRFRHDRTAFLADDTNGTADGLPRNIDDTYRAQLTQWWWNNGQVDTNGDRAPFDI